MKKPKLAIVTHTALTPVACGSARYITEVTPRLAGEFDVTVICKEGRGVEGEERSPNGFKRIPLPSFYSRLALNDLPKYGEETKKILEESDLAFVHDPVCLKPLWQLWRRLKIPWAMYIHGLEWEVYPHNSRRALWRGLSRKGALTYCRFWYERSERLFVPSEATRRKIREIGVRTAIDVIPHGIDSEKFCPAVDKEALRSSLKLPQDALILLCHGRIAKDRNLPLLVQVFKMAKADFPNLFLLLIGNGPKREITRMERLLRGATDIRLLSAKDPIASWIQASDIFCLLSSMETFSLATLEAFACAKPVLVPAHPAIREYLNDGEEGFFLESFAPDAIAGKLKALLSSEELRNKMGRKGRKRVLENFSWEKTTRQLARSFHELLERKQNGKTL